MFFHRPATERPFVAVKLAVSLDGRPEGLVGGVTVEDVEVLVEYGPYPSALDASPRA